MVFKSEEMPDELNEDVGPVIVVHTDDPPNEEERGWMSRSEAKQSPRILGMRSRLTGPLATNSNS